MTRGCLAARALAAGGRLARVRALAAGGRAGGEADAILAGDPDGARGWQIKGVAALLEGRAAATVEALPGALVLAPKDAAARTRLGVARRQAQEAGAAAWRLERATTQRPGPAKREHSPGVLCRKWVRLEDAKRHFGRAGGADPASDEGWFELGRVALAPSVREEARTRQAGPLPQAQAILGPCLQGSGALDPALGVCRAILGRDPSLDAAVVENLTTAAERRLWLRPRDRRALLGEAPGADR